MVSNLNCSGCGAEIADGTRFCRQCGQPFALAAASAAEAVTQVFEPRGADDHSTRRLNPKATNPTDYALGQVMPAEPATRGLPRHGHRRTVLIRTLLVLLLVATAGIVLAVVLRSRSPSAVSRSLIYPGSQIIVDMKSQEGGALHLRTRDPFDRVIEWYKAKLNPTKTMKLSETNIMLKTGNTTAVIATEEKETNIVIKQAAVR